MKILFVAFLDGWMGIHIRQFATGFASFGHEVKLLDYKRMARGQNPFARSPKTKHELRHRALEKEIRDFRPDMIIFVIANLKFDFVRIKSFYKNSIVVYDMDGPGWKCYDSLEWTEDVDLLLTVSRVSQRFLRARGVRAEYLAHGVDTAYYHPLELNRQDADFYGSTLSFVGRPTARRIRMFSSIANRGLAVWGRRWSRSGDCPLASLRKTARSKKDIIGGDVVKIYSSSDMMLNILREPLHEPPTIMSLQVFLVPACGTCLLTEWVEELEEAFEPGREVLAFSSEDEFKEQVLRYSGNKKLLAKIGANGRKRCLDNHTHENRAAELLGFIG
ncbi:MAG: glycosyltransferase [Victivallaceae bacterium]|nr:glycosyltransferase [Victivallaceae bacterium]